MASVSEITSASDLQMDYMKLLVTQLQYQNPLEPMDNNQMATQLAQFSQLQQLESVNASFSEALTTANRSYANSLIGKTVSFRNSESEDSQIGQMIVDAVYNNVEGEIVLVGGNQQTSLGDIISVMN